MARVSDPITPVRSKDLINVRRSFAEPIAAAETIARNHWPRPTQLLAKPELVEAMALLLDGPPAAFTRRGARRKVKRADGPERVFGERWKRDAELSTVRDYFQVEDEGARYWLYHAGDCEHADTGSQQWFLHGTFG